MKFENNSFEEHINSLINTAMKLSSYLPLNRYFRAVEGVQNSYMVELRRIYAVKLLKEGLSNSDIARLLCKDHATISYLVKTTNEDDPIRKEIIDKCADWIYQGLYPVTYTEILVSSDHKTGFKSIVNYELKSIENGGNSIGQNSSADPGVETMARS